MAEGQQLDPWQSSYLRLKSMSAMLSEIQFMMESRRFMDSTQEFSNESSRHRESWEQKLDRTDEKIDRLSDMVLSLLPKDATNSNQSQGIGANQLQEMGVNQSWNAIGANQMRNEVPPSVLEGPVERLRDMGITNNSTTNSSNPVQDSANQSSSVFGNGMNRFSKIDFPSFDGTNPRSWVRKCEKYFSIFSIEGQQRIELAAMYVQGRADTWLQGFLMQSTEVSWEVLTEAVCSRFGQKQDFDLIEEFNKLEQKDYLDDYNEKFEELRACLLAVDPQLPESYFVTSYISGLKQEIKNLVKLNRPKTLAAAYEEARMQFDAIQAIISELEQEYGDPNNSMESVEDWDADFDRDADFGCQGLIVLGVNPKEYNREPRDQSYIISNELRGKATSLNLVAKCEKLFRSYEINDAHQLFEEMSNRGFSEGEYSVQVSNAQLQMGNWVFDPGSVEILNCKCYGYFDELQGHFESCYAVIFDGNNQETDVNTRQSVDVNASENDCFGANLKGSRNWIVCAGNSNCMMANGEPILTPFDRGKQVCVLGSAEVPDAKKRPQWEPGGNCCFWRNSIPKPLSFFRKKISAYECFKEQVSFKVLVFDPGIVHKLDLQAVLIDGCWVLRGLIFVFDPGGSG